MRKFSDGVRKKPMRTKHSEIYKPNDGIYIVFSLFFLFSAWAAYLIARTYSGTTLISDETFFVYQDITGQNKRIVFLTLVQAFDDWESARYFISSLNLVAILASYLLMRKFFFKKDLVILLYIIYFTAISNYIFRDAMLFFLVISSACCVISENKYAKLGLLITLPLIYDFRPHYLILLIAAFAAATLARFIVSNRIFIFLGIMSVVGVYVSLYYLGDNLMVYGISAREYLAVKEQRYSQDLNSVTFTISFLTHYFAPLPTSLLDRALFGPPLGEPLSPYGSLDDLYRIVYKVFLYWCFAYIAINFRYIVQVVDRYRFNFVFFLTFSVSNAILYSAVNFGGGHERVKMFSGLILVYTAAAILHVKPRAKPEAGL